MPPDTLPCGEETLLHSPPRPPEREGRVSTQTSGKGPDRDKIKEEDSMKNENPVPKANAGTNAGRIPIRCSVCGKPFLHVYLNSMPGIIFATCLSGHKTSYPAGGPARKAV